MCVPSTNPLIHTQMFKIKNMEIQSISDPKNLKWKILSILVVTAEIRIWDIWVNSITSHRRSPFSTLYLRGCRVTERFHPLCSCSVLSPSVHWILYLAVSFVLWASHLSFRKLVKLCAWWPTHLVLIGFPSVDLGFYVPWIPSVWRQSLSISFSTGGLYFCEPIWKLSPVNVKIQADFILLWPFSSLNVSGLYSLLASIAPNEKLTVRKLSVPPSSYRPGWGLFPRHHLHLLCSAVVTPPWVCVTIPPGTHMSAVPFFSFGISICFSSVLFRWHHLIDLFSKFTLLSVSTLWFTSSNTSLH